MKALEMLCVNYYCDDNWKPQHARKLDVAMLNDALNSIEYAKSEKEQK